MEKLRKGIERQVNIFAGLSPFRAPLAGENSTNECLSLQLSLLSCLMRPSFPLIFFFLHLSPFSSTGGLYPLCTDRSKKVRSVCGKGV
jgi:hypothetical protein